MQRTEAQSLGLLCRFSEQITAENDKGFLYHVPSLPKMSSLTFNVKSIVLTLLIIMVTM